MSPESVRLLGLAAFLAWVQIACRYILPLPYPLGSHRAFARITCAGAALQSMVCVAFVILFPSVFCFVSVAAELGAIGAVVYILRFRNTVVKPASDKLIRSWIAGITRKHGLMVCACIGSGAGFMIYMAPII